MKKFRQSRMGQWLLPFLAYLTLAVVLTWPLASKLSTHLPDGTDSLLHYWNGWMSWQALNSGQSPYFTKLLFFPNGLSMVFNNFAWLHIVGWLVMRPLLGGVDAYNVVFLLNLAICGLAACWLSYEVIGNRRAALLAGLVYQAWPHRLTQPSHPNLMSTWAIPLFLLFLIRAVKYRRWQDGIWAGLSLALVGYMRWQLLIGAVIVGGLYLLLGQRKALNRQSAGVLALGGAIGFLTLLPPMILLATEMSRNPIDVVAASDESTVQTDLLAYVTPAGSHFLLGDLTETLYETYYADRGSRSAISPYIGLATLFLVVLAIWKGPRGQTLPWLAIAALLFLLALGPVLRVGGRLVDLPMPYDLVRPFVIPVLLREPDRFNIFLALPVAMLAAYGAGQLQSNKTSDRRLAACAMPALAALILLEYLSVPMPIQPARVSPVFDELAAEPGEFAILNVPVDPYKSKPYMQAQTVHGRPILQGHSSRYPAGAFEYLENQPWLSSMMKFDQVPPLQGDVSRQLAELAEVGIRYMVLHKQQIEPGAMDKWRRYLAMDPWYEDDTVLVYRTELQAGRDFSLEAESAPGIGIIGSQLSTNCLNPESPLAVEIAWGTSTFVGQEYEVQMALSRSEEQPRQLHRFPIADRPIMEWGENAIVLGYYEWPIPADFEAGPYQLSATLLDDGHKDGPSTVLGEVVVQDQLCAYGLPSGAQASNATFGHKMRLLGYELVQGKEAVAVTLYWRGERRMLADYKVFVHIFDPATGVPVAQNDAMPRNWRYPTSLWGLDELIDDPITISTDGVAVGQYGVAIGVYDPVSGERLQVIDGAGQPVSDSRLVLPLILSFPQ